jgi:hypothetical protein
MKRWSIAQTLITTTCGAGQHDCTPMMKLSFLRTLFPTRVVDCGQSASKTINVSSSIRNNKYYLGRTFATLRGGAHDDDPSDTSRPLQNHQRYTVLSDPAPGSPFHYAFPVHDLDLAKEFYGNVLGCVEGRSSTKWQDYSLHGHQIVAHWVGNTYRCQDYYNPVDGDEVPVPRTLFVSWFVVFIFDYAN